MGRIKFLVGGVILAISLFLILRITFQKREYVGDVNFSVSCSSDVHADVNRAVAYLHSFEYGSAETIFNQIVKTDPTCTMAYWGKAMTYWHPLWTPPSRSALIKGIEAVAEARKQEIRTPRERMYVDAIHVFYANNEQEDRAVRTKNYTHKMRELHEQYPDDIDAAAFYALALNAAAEPDDMSYSLQREAGVILETILSHNPRHPGALHYLIHSYDYPPLAERALQAAREYPLIAASSSHARHMAAHIFILRGLWEESISANIDSLKKDVHVPQKDLHALDFLLYSYLQAAKDTQAADIARKVSAITQKSSSRGRILARVVIEQKKWPQGAALESMRQSPDALFVHALSSLRTCQIDSAQKDIDDLDAISDRVMQNGNVSFAQQIRTLSHEAAGLLAFMEKRNDEALNHLREAADIENAISRLPMYPALVPAREFFADILLEMGMANEALEQYELSLQTYPKRFWSLYGAGRAAERCGRHGDAKQYYQTLIALTKDGNTQRDEVRYAKNFLGIN